MRCALSSILLTLMGVSILILGLGVFVSAIVTLCLKGNARSIALNVLLVLATLQVVVGIGANFLPKDVVATKVSNKHALKTELASTEKAFLLTQNTQALPDWIRKFVALEGYSGTQDAQTQLTDALGALFRERQDDPRLALDYAVALHESGKDPEFVFDQYKDVHEEKNPQLSALQLIYEGKQPPANCARIFDSLPDGWFRDKILMSVAHANDPQKFQLMKALEDAAANKWCQRFETILIIRFIMALIGIPAIVLWFLTNKGLFQLEKLPLTFRAIYGSCVSVGYAQFGAGFGIGLIIGIEAALNHVKANLGAVTWTIMWIAICAGCVGAFVAAYFFICKVQNLSFNKFWSDDARPPVLQSALAVGGGVAAISLVNTVVHILLRMVRGTAITTNPAHLQLTNTILIGHGFSIVGCAIVVCLVAPVAEEILFRGIVYRGMRQRWPVWLSAVCSAFIFALWHGDLPGFAQYFVIGIVLAGVYERSKSLWVPMCLHGLWNFWVVVYAFAVLRA